MLVFSPKAADCSCGHLLCCQAGWPCSCTQSAVVRAVNSLHCVQPCPAASQCWLLLKGLIAAARVPAKWAWSVFSLAQPVLSPVYVASHSCLLLE